MASALLTMDASRRLARTFRCWSTREQARLLAVIGSLADDWRRDWQIPTVAGTHRWEVRIFDAPASSPLAKRVSLNDEAVQQDLAEAMFGATPTGADAHLSAVALPTPGMAREVAVLAWQDWLVRLDEVGAGSPALAAVVASTGDGHDDGWNGCLTIAFAWPSGDWFLKLDGDRVAHILQQHAQSMPSEGPTGPSPSAALVPLAKALDRRPLPVRVHLADVTLTLGQLQSLALGDVVALSHRLVDPAALLLTLPGATPGRAGHAAAGTAAGTPAKPLCAAWLGQSQGQLAVELLSSP